MCRACEAFVEVGEAELERARNFVAEAAPRDIRAANVVNRIITAFEVVQETYKKERQSMIDDALYHFGEGEVEN